MSESGKSSILVVGAGPAGLAAAVELRRRGFPVRIIDKLDIGTKESRAVAVNNKTLRLLEPSGATAKLVARGVHLRGLRFIVDGSEALHVRLTRLPKPYDFMLALPQTETESILIETLAELGTTVERGLECVAVRNVETGAIATLRDEAGTETEVVVDWIVAADGAHSTIRKALGLDFQGAAYPFRWSLADVDLSGDVSADEGEARLSLGSPFLLRFPIAPGRHRLISNAPDVLKTMPKSWIAGTVHWQSDFTVSHRMIDRRLIGCIALIGDAAHIHSPAGGRGMNLGIEDAASFAEALAAGSFEGWEAKRLKRAHAVLTESDRLQGIVTLRNGALPRLLLFMVTRIARLPFVQKFVVDRIAAVNE